MKQAGYGVGGDGDACLLEQLSDLVGSLASPPQTGDGIAGGVVLQQNLDGLH